MKKGICLVLILMCCAWVALPALAEAPAFDHTLLEDKTGYSYDKFDKTWTYMAIYFDSASASGLALQIEGEKNTLQSPPIFYVQSDGLGKPESLDLLIGETVTTIDLVMAMEDTAIFYLGSSEADLLRALLDAEELSVRIVGEDKKVTFDISQEQMEKINTQRAASLKAWLEVVVQYQLWDDANWSDDARSTYSYYKPVITVH